MSQSGKPPYNALVLGAQRPGVVNPLAEAAQVSHKCLIDMHGKALVDHVISALAASPDIAHITVSIDSPDALQHAPICQQLISEGRLSVVRSAPDIFASIERALETDKNTAYPLLVTTADNVLLTPDMVAHFVDQCRTKRSKFRTDAVIAMTRKEVLLAEYPDGQRRFHRFKDGEWSNCNLYALLSPQAIKAAEAFKTGGQFAKSKARVIKAFGLLNALVYVFALATRDRAMARMSSRFKAVVNAVDMPFAEAPIDVDNERTQRIAGEILGARLGAQPANAAE